MSCTYTSDYADPVTAGRQYNSLALIIHAYTVLPSCIICLERISKWMYVGNVAPKPPPKRAQKCNTAVFRVKLHFTWRQWKSATKLLCVHTVSDRVARHSLSGWSFILWASAASAVFRDVHGPKIFGPARNFEAISRSDPACSSATTTQSNKVVYEAWLICISCLLAGIENW